MRSKRKVSRVNYAEENNDDEVEPVAEATPVVDVGSKGKKSVKSNGTKRDSTTLSAADKFPLNWQRRVPAGEKTSSVMDFDGAVLKEGVLRLLDGTSLGPEGMYIIQTHQSKPATGGTVS